MAGYIPQPQSYFNPRSPCGERQGVSSRYEFDAAKFQSTLPVWGATKAGTITIEDVPISIHAPRVGSDFAVLQRASLSLDFNPRSPCGERRVFF